MAAVVVAVADAVVAALNAATFTGLHTAVFAERKYREDDRLQDLGGKVYARVYKRASKTLTVDRNFRKQRDVLIEVAIKRRTSFANTNDADELEALVEQVEALFLGKLLTVEDVDECACVASDVENSPEQMQNAETFAALISLTFRAVG